MKKTLVSTLALTLLVLGIAGIAWAGQAAVQEPVAEAPDQAPEATLPTEDGEQTEIILEGLFQDPTEMTGACCVADCMSERDACKSACPPFGDPNRQACIDQCNAEYDACRSHC